MSKLVSVIIPSYCGSIYLRRCVDSVLAQTYKEIEVIVVDDNGLGTENQLKTAEVMMHYADDDRVKYICHEANINGSAARNTGVRNSSGDYIALMDDDDEFYSGKIEKQVELLNSLSNNVGLVYCSFDVYYDETKVSETHAINSGNLLYECLMHKFQIPSTAILVRRTVYEAVGGFDESFKRHQDWEFVDKIAARYQIQADDFKGFKRNLEFRNKSNTPELFKERRLYYIEKMMPLINTLTPQQRRDVIVWNKMDIVLEFFKQRRYKKAFRELIEIKAFYRELKYLLQRSITVIKRRKIRLVR